MFRGDTKNGPPRVVVAGAGPAGLMIASELARLRIDVQLVAPDPFEPFRASYGVFESLLPSEFRAVAVSRHASLSVYTPSGREHSLNEPYLRLDSVRLQKQLLDRCRESGVRVEAGTLADWKDRVQDSLIVDATGSTKSRGAYYQTAYGVWCEVPGAKGLGSAASLMDFRIHGGAQLPSFLYAFPEQLPSGRQGFFLQETVLIADQPGDFQVLRARLNERLARMGVQAEAAEKVELACIRLGGSREHLGGSTVRFGAAAGMTHPATGYQVCRCLARASSVAKAIATGSSLEESAELAHRALWGSGRRSTFSLFERGAHVLCGLQGDDLDTFLSAFFESGRARQLAEYLDGSLSLLGTLGLMARTYRRADSSLRSQLRKAVFPPPSHQLSALASQSNVP